MDCIIDTSTLISLARIHFLELIPRLDLQVIFPAEVYSEAVIQGEEKGYADATVIKNFIKRHAIRSVDVKTSSIAALRRKTEKALPKGDEAVLALALKEKSRMVLTDDDGLGKIAFSLGCRVKAAPDLLLEGLKKNVITGAEFESYMRGLVIENRLNPVVAELYLMEGKKNVKG